jgi:hypothetical protein
VRWGTLKNPKCTLGRPRGQWTLEKIKRKPWALYSGIPALAIVFPSYQAQRKDSVGRAQAWTSLWRRPGRERGSECGWHELWWRGTEGSVQPQATLYFQLLRDSRSRRTLLVSVTKASHSRSKSVLQDPVQALSDRSHHSFHPICGTHVSLNPRPSWGPQLHFSCRLGPSSVHTVPQRLFMCDMSLPIGCGHPGPCPPHLFWACSNSSWDFCEGQQMYSTKCQNLPLSFLINSCQLERNSHNYEYFPKYFKTSSKYLNV